MSNNIRFWRLVAGIFRLVFLAGVFFLVWIQVAGFTSNKIRVGTGIILFIVTVGTCAISISLSKAAGNFFSKIAIITELVGSILMVIILVQLSTEFKLFPITQRLELTFFQYAALIIYTFLIGISGVTGIFIKINEHEYHEETDFQEKSIEDFETMEKSAEESVIDCPKHGVTTSSEDNECLACLLETGLENLTQLFTNMADEATEEKTEEDVAISTINCTEHGLIIQNENGLCGVCSLMKDLDEQVPQIDTLSQKELRKLAKDCEEIRSELMRINPLDFKDCVAEACKNTQEKGLEIVDQKLSVILSLIENSGVNCPKHGFFETMEEEKGCLICAFETLLVADDYDTIDKEQLAIRKATYQESLRQLEVRKDLEFKRPNRSLEKIEILHIQEKILKGELRKIGKKMQEGVG